MPTNTTIIDRLRAHATRAGMEGGPGIGQILHDALLEAADALTAAHAARDAAERKALHESRVADTLARQYQDRTDEVYALRAQLTTAIRERDEARAALEAARSSCDHKGVCLFIDAKPDGTR